MPVNYESRMHKALNEENPRNSVEAIKETVISELEALDPRIRITSTEYFNHTYIPDLVASWPSKDKPRERYIYLKFNSQISYLLEDMSLVKENTPIVFGLSRTPRDQGRLPDQLDHDSKQSNTLVTDSLGVQRLISVANSQFLTLAASSLAQGGRGLLDDPAADRTTAALDEGFNGAMHANEFLTRRATKAVDEVFSQETASRMNGLLQAVWVGAGGKLEDFPGNRDLQGKISDDALQFLLEYQPIDNYDFWRKVGSHVSLSQICRLDIPSGTKNLDHFIHSNRDRIWAKVCRVKSEQIRPEEIDSYSWFIERNLLVFKGEGYDVYLGDAADSMRLAPPDVSEGVPLKNMLNRVKGTPVIDADLATNGRSIKYSSVDHGDISKDEMISDFAKSESVRVKRVSVPTRNRKNLTCDLTTSTATGWTNAQIDLSDLIISSLPILREMSEDERSEIVALFQSHKFSSRQLDLLDSSESAGNDDA